MPGWGGGGKESRWGAGATLARQVVTRRVAEEGRRGPKDFPFVSAALGVLEDVIAAFPTVLFSCLLNSKPHRKLLDLLPTRLAVYAPNLY